MKALLIRAGTSLLCLSTTAAGAFECRAGTAAFPRQYVRNTAGVQIEPAPIVPDGRGKFKSPINEFTFGLLRAADVGLVRTLLAWRRVETNPGEFDWDFVDPFLEQAARSNIRLQIYLTEGSNPISYQAIPGPYPYSSFDDPTNFIEPFTRFCTKVVEHCTETMNRLNRKSASKYPGAALPITWEVWNEPNLGPMTPEQYMVLANSVIPAMRNADKRHRGRRAPATFVAPALSVVNRPDAPEPARGRNAIRYIEECLGYHKRNGLGLAELVDGVSIHPYRPENPESIVEPLASNPGYPTSTYADFRKAIGARLPIVAGEWGYTSVSNFWGANISMQMQADYLARMNLVNLSECIPYTIWYFLNSNDDPSDGLNNFGILHADGSPKPSYYALKTLTSALRGAWFDKKLGATDPRGPNWIVFRAPARRGPEKRILAAWNAANVNSISTNSDWGTYVLTGTPLYVGQRLTWQGGATGTWSLHNGWTGGIWAGDSKFGDNYQAVFDKTATISVDGSYRIGGLHFNAEDVRLMGSGSLEFTDGGGNLYARGSGTIACRIAGGGDPSTFVLRKSGKGIIGLGAANDFRGRVLIKEGALAMGDERALGDISNPITLDGGELITQGVRLKTGNPIEIIGLGSIISNYTSSTSLVESSINVGADVALVGSQNTSMELSGALHSPKPHTMTKYGESSLTLSGGGGDGNLGLVVKEGTVTVTSCTHLDAIQVASGGKLMLAGGASIGTSSLDISLSGMLLHNSATPLDRTISFQGTASTFGGTGWYARELKVNWGRISPGSEGAGSIGTLTINGDITLGPDTTLDFDFSAQPNSDKLHFAARSHTLILDGILNITGPVAANWDYPIITNIGHYQDRGLVFGRVPPGKWSYRFLPRSNHGYDLCVSLNKS